MATTREFAGRVLTAVLGVCLGSASVLLAADEASTNEVKKLAPVYVTGSNIPTLETEPVAPVLKLDRQFIDESGAQNVSELLRKLPMNSAGSFAENNASSFSPGSSGISLRGLGQQSTLVLINGRRVAPYGFGQNVNGVTAGFVDLNSIPLGAIEKVEILKDSGSALYGSDAIAGVVNIVLRKDYQGLELGSSIGNTFNNDAFEQTHSLVGGTQTEKASLMLFLDYYDRNAQQLHDRPQSNTANQTPRGIDFRSGSSDVGRVIDPISGNRLYVPPTSNGILTPNDFLTSRPDENRYNFNRYISDTPATTRYGAYTVLDYKLTEKLTFFVEGSYRKIMTTEQSAATPIDGENDPLHFMVPASNPFNPFGTNVVFRWRATQAGPRIEDINTDAVRAVPGLRFALNDDWNFETAYLYSYSQTIDNGRNFLSVNGLNAALADTNPATALNVFGNSAYVNNPNTINAMKVQTTREATDEVWIYDIRGSGKLYELPAGTLAVAFGGETSHQSLTDNPDSLSSSFQIVSQGGVQPTSGARDEDALYGELSIPIFSQKNARTALQSLEMQLAGRFEYYSDFGTVYKPKIGLKWQPLSSLVIKASYSEGFRAPTLQELYVQNRGFQDGYVDTARYNVTGSDADGGGTQYQIDSGGNAALKPENSESWYVGGVYQVPFVKGLSLSVDYLHITVTDVIQAQDVQQILDLPLAQQAAFVHRNAPSASDIAAGIPGTIVSIDQRFINLSKRIVDSIDFGAEYVRPIACGDLTFNVSGTYYPSWKEQIQPGDPTAQLAGHFDIPQVRGYANVFWNYKHWNLGPTVNYTSSYADNFLGKTIGEYITVDAQVTYQAPWSTTITFGVNNIADQLPPLSTQNTEGYDTAVADNVGRFWYLRATKSF